MRGRYEYALPLSSSFDMVAWGSSIVYSWCRTKPKGVRSVLAVCTLGCRSGKTILCGKETVRSSRLARDTTERWYGCLKRELLQQIVGTHRPLCQNERKSLHALAVRGRK